MRHAVLQQAASGVAGGAGEPAFEGGAEERGGGKARQDLAHRQRDRRPRIEADGAVHRGAVVAQRAGVGAIGERREIRPRQRLLHELRGGAAQGGGRSFRAEGNRRGEPALGQSVEALGGAAFAELEFEGVEIVRAETIAPREDVGADRRDFPRAEAREVQQQGQGDVLRHVQVG